MVEQARTDSQHTIIWLQQIVPTDDLISLSTHASIFVCPSVYEPFGTTTLEAMACETPVAASAVGGIPEVVAHDDTGLLVPFEPISAENFEPKDPERFARDLAGAINSLLHAPEKMQAMGRKACERVEQYFSWGSIAQRALEIYRALTPVGGVAHP